jgi:hypothetical protein
MPYPTISTPDPLYAAKEGHAVSFEAKGLSRGERFLLRSRRARRARVFDSMTSYALSQHEMDHAVFKLVSIIREFGNVSSLPCLLPMSQAHNQEKGRVSRQHLA